MDRRMLPVLKMLCLDFDGTVLVYDHPEGVFPPTVIECLNGLARRSVRWCTNSGRDLPSQTEVLKRSCDAGLQHMPAAILCSETMIFPADGRHYRPWEAWNRRAGLLLRRFHARAQETLRPFLEDWQRRYQPRSIVHAQATVFQVENKDGLPERLLAEVRAATQNLPGSIVTQNGGWVAVLPEDLGKGNVLRAYLHHAGLSPDVTLAIGDHVNDLSMLDGLAATRLGCPSDAAPAVRESVARAGGRIASAPGPEGTVEIIQYYLDQEGKR